MQKYLSCLLVLLALVLPMLGMEADAAEIVDSGTCGENLTWTLDDAGTLTISGTGNMKDYYYSNQPWYSQRNSIVSIVVEDGVTSIGNYAFNDCDRLSSITIPDSVTTIGSRAFYDCYSLSSITIPDSVTSIGEDAFYSCDRLSSITIPDSVTSIGYNAFFFCDSLSRVEITDIAAWCQISFGNYFSNPLYYADEGLFLNGAPIESVVLPEGITAIPDGAFRNCIALCSITIPEGVTSIGDYAFSGCTSLESITIPDSVTTIGDYAFYNCDSLSSIKIPEGVTSIEGSAFEGCTSLESITIPEGVTSIEGSAFQGCTGLSSITIPEGVTSIGEGAFSGCSGLESMTIPFVGKSVQSEYPFGYIFGESSYTGGTATYQSYSTYYIPSSLKSVTVTGGNIFYGAFYNCSNLTSITIPDSATSIGEDAFSSCDSLSSITIPDSVTSIGEGAFYNCVSLSSITIPDSVTSIGESAFADCISLNGIWVDDENPSYSTDDRGVLFDKNKTRLIRAPGGISGAYSIPDSVTSIYDYAFEGCASLTGITIPDGVTSIAEGAFSGCSSLESMTIPFVGESVQSEYPFGYIFGRSSYTGGTATNQSYSTYYIPSSLKSVTVTGGNILYGAFYNCGNLTSITIPEGVTSIGEDAFYNCDSLSSITIPDSVTSIGSYAFFFCDSLSTVVIGNGVTTIGYGAFTYCGSLSSITIPDSVTNIGDSAFFGCDSLSSITIPDSVTNIGENTFYYCDALTDITLPESILFIRKDAFSNCRNLNTVHYAGTQAQAAEITILSGNGRLDDATWHYECSGVDCIAPPPTVPEETEPKETEPEVTDPETTDPEGTEPEVTDPETTDPEGTEPEETEPEVTEPDEISPSPECEFYLEGYVGETFTVELSSSYSYDYELTGENSEHVSATLTSRSSIVIGSYGSYCHGYELVFSQPGFYELTFVQQVTGNTVYFEANISPKPVIDNPFGDVAEDAYYFDPVLWAVDNGITNGLSEDSFGPEATCTRGQIVTFLWRACGSPEPKMTFNPFSDMSSDDYFYKAVLWAVENGITSGMGDGTFAPNAGCTRGQVATFLWRSQGQPSVNGENIFTDIAPGAYYYDAVLWAVDEGITNGMGEGLFAPDATCTRGQIVTFLYRAMA